jgi:putative acetyltransferase
VAHAPRSKIAKIELTVFTNNAPAIALYRKHDFTEIGVIRDYRRLDGVTYDALLMERRLR